MGRITKSAAVLRVAEPLVQQLARCFRISCPDVWVQPYMDGKRGTYQYWEEPPLIALAARGFKLDVVLHEFAHHLQYLEHGYPTTERPHGPQFFEQLWRVASHYHGDVEKYDWPWCEVATPETIKRFHKANVAPPLVEAYPEAFKESAQECARLLAPCKLCKSAAAGK